MFHDRTPHRVLVSMGKIQAPNLSNGTIVTMLLQESHYLSTESVAIDC